MGLKEEFLRYAGSIKRNGIDELLKWLEDETDFYTAPASTRYHLSVYGGLVRHSCNVFIAAQHLEVNRRKDMDADTRESIAIITLFHDICKTNFYEAGTRNVKDANGKWVQEPCFNVKDTFPFGHGEKSVYLIEKHGLELKREEVLAIRWHMAGWDNAVKGGEPAINLAFMETPLCTILSISDMTATYRSDPRSVEKLSGNKNE